MMRIAFKFHVDTLGSLCQRRTVLGETKSQFALIRAAPIGCGRES